MQWPQETRQLQAMYVGDLRHSPNRLQCGQHTFSLKQPSELSHCGCGTAVVVATEITEKLVENGQLLSGKVWHYLLLLHHMPVSSTGCTFHTTFGSFPSSRARSWCIRPVATIPSNSDGGQSSLKFKARVIQWQLTPDSLRKQLTIDQSILWSTVPTTGLAPLAHIADVSGAFA